MDQTAPSLIGPVLQALGFVVGGIVALCIIANTIRQFATTPTPDHDKEYITRGEHRLAMIHMENKVATSHTELSRQIMDMTKELHGLRESIAVLIDRSNRKVDDDEGK